MLEYSIHFIQTLMINPITLMVENMNSEVGWFALF